MADQHLDLDPVFLLSAQDIDEVVSQFRLRTSGLSHQQMQKLFSDLPKVTEADLIASDRHDGVCPICFNTLLAILAEEETAHAMDSPAHPVEELGVTKLQNTCGHIFCRKDITKWIMEGHDSCPSCRRPLLTDAERQDNAALPPSQVDSSSGAGWARHWPPESNMVARDPRLLTQLPILSLNPLHALGAGRPDHADNTHNRNEFAGMYS
ncbi:hypothetical protein BDN67DRAFT_966086 [Paxillus ammoniavirescens]|nr:hypothetical protein BDN67DRAFT_966086 [Paxillus ammoniavirescens]